MFWFALTLPSTLMALQHPEGMVVKVVVLAFMFANTEQGGVMGFFLPLMPRGQILLSPKVFKPKAL